MDIFDLPRGTSQMRAAAAMEPTDAPAILLTMTCGAYSLKQLATPT